MKAHTCACVMCDMPVAPYMANDFDGEGTYRFRSSSVKCPHHIEMRGFDDNSVLLELPHERGGTLVCLCETINNEFYQPAPNG